jgi:hypothetical protein
MAEGAKFELPLWHVSLYRLDSKSKEVLKVTKIDVGVTKWPLRFVFKETWQLLMAK